MPPRRRKPDRKQPGAPRARRDHPAVVGIGTSAGGLAALRGFFDHVPSNSGLAYVVVVHLSPEHESHLAELLQPHVRMPVRQVTDSVPLEANQVYVIPPNANLESVDTHLRLSDVNAPRRQRAPIDHFFRTLSRTHDGHAIGVILTGTGSDGTLGLKEIKEKGGLTVVQDPRDAEYDGMPQSAIATGLIDLVLPLAQIPAALLRYVATKPRLPPADAPEPDGRDGRALLQKIFAQIRARTGRDFSGYKRSTILRRIARRMQLAQVEELAAYLELLRHRPEEVVGLADDLLITVTSFFRDAEAFQTLEQEIIPRFMSDQTENSDVRVWSVGCATGEEAYSIAMLLVEAAARIDHPPRLQIFASDMHEHSLAMAREGFYPGDIEADVPVERLKRFFRKEDGGYRVRKDLRELVVFAPHNLLADPPFSRLDLIMCRNLLIYLERDVQRDVIDLFHYALRQGGFLMLGPSETLEAANLFAVEHKQHCIYRKRNVPAPEPRLPVFPLTRLRGLKDADRPPRADAPVAQGALHQRLVERYAPPSMLINPDDKIVHLSEHAGRYLLHPGGELTSSVHRLVRKELRIDLRAALHDVRERGMPRRTMPALVRFNGETCFVALDVRPASAPEDAGFILVIFDERPGASRGELPPVAEAERPRTTPEQPDAQQRSAPAAEGVRVRELQAERDLARQRLQAIIEEYETSQEEMKASNEELQSINEELRSTLEELETSKEELQSMNEELQTVNQENRHKVEELAQLSADLQNLLAATDIATLFLDRELRILRFTPRVGELFHVRATDRGRPLADLTHRLADSELLDDAARVLERLIPVEREIHDREGHWYLVRVGPYRSVEDRIEGVVITFVDISSRVEAEQALRELNETLEQRVEERTRQVRELAATLTMAEQQERRRISQLLHDDLQQLLYGIQMKLASAREQAQEGNIDELLAATDRSMALLGDAINHTRHLTVDLSPPVLEGEGLLEALEWIRTQMRELHGLHVEIRADRPVTIAAPEMRVLLFQSVRELLFNVAKHGATERALVEVSERDGFVTLSVSDDGRGFDPATLRMSEEDAAKGWGLFSMRERLRLQGGDAEVVSRPGGGTTVAVHVPISKTSRSNA